MTDPRQNILNQETIINTRKEHWNTLFCWIDFSKTKWKDKFYNKEQQFWPMPQTFVDWQKEVTELLVEKHGEIEEIINFFKSYFDSDIYPILKEKFGDKALLFRCERLLNSKIIGETSSLFPDALGNNSGDLVIFEIEYRQQAKFKEFLPRLRNIIFTNELINNQWVSDLEKMEAGKVSYNSARNFWFKWGDKLENRELAQEVDDYLKLWQKGKGANSQWKSKLKAFAVQIDDYFTKKAGGQLFFQLGFIKWQDKDGLIIATQNRKGWDLNNPYLMIFWFHQKPQQSSPLAYRSYFVGNFRTSDPRKLYVSLDLDEDWIWKNYGRALLSPGSLETNNHPIYHERNLPTLPDKKLHYPFCLDLGDKEVYYLDTDQNPFKWQLYIINHPNFVETLLDDAVGLFNGGNMTDFYDDKGIKFPKNIYKIERYNSSFTGLLKGEVNLFLAPKDFYTGKTAGGVGTQVSNNFYEKGYPNLSFKLADYDYTTKNPTPINASLRKQINDNLTNYNHLIDHSSFQFCFNQDTMFSANLRYLDLRKEGEEWLIKYNLKVKATPAGTYYTFLSGNILWQLRIEVKQAFPTGKTLKALLNLGMLVVTVTGAFMIAGALGMGGAGLADGAILNNISGDLNKIKQTNQLLQSAKSILPEQNENISFSMSLFDFWSKLRKRPFWGKIYVSNNLKNNLAHNNHENPITLPLNITFDKFWKVLKKGEYQGNLKLDYDPDKYLSNKFKESITFFEDKEKDFITPELGLKQATNLLVYNLSNAGDYMSEEIKEFVWIENPFDYDAENKGYSHSTYLTVDNSSVRGSGWKGLNWKHWDDSKGWCWGCTQELFSPDGYKGNAHDPNSPPCPPFAKKEVGKFTPSQDCTVEMKLHVDGSNTIYENLKGGTEYTIAVDHQKIYFGYLKNSGTIFHTIPTQDDFDNLNWLPTGGMGTDIEIPIIDPEINIPDTASPDFTPDYEPDLPDLGGGEPEIFIEPDISIEPDVPDNEPDFPEPDIPEPEITPPEPETDPNDPDNTPDIGDPELPDNDIPNNDNNDYE